MMKKIFFIGCILIAILIGCTTSKKVITTTEKIKKLSDTLRIANDSLNYEVIIIEPGFNSWLISRARLRNYYTENFLEGRNRVYVTEWNNRVMQPTIYKPSIYEMQINYDLNIHYGYEVNYLIYNYFTFFQLNYNQQLAGFVPRF